VLGSYARGRQPDLPRPVWVLGVAGLAAAANAVRRTPGGRVAPDAAREGVVVGTSG